ncbi:MAG: pyruvate dehydrogenase (acetyl-transferring), homodimeric type [Gammaproteobacteria bacterium]|nr:pyruvate dehydrogenase (acetyl-transferring), homodimeric type [Gammaproteobacteria bacterium]
MGVVNDEKKTEIDVLETQEWCDALEDVLEADGPERVAYLIRALVTKAQLQGVPLSFVLNSPYRNTIPVSQEKHIPHDHGIAHQVNALIRWNAVAMVLRAGKHAPELGGHIATYASASILYEVGFNHFFKGPQHPEGADLLYIQGHSSPGIYARAFLEGRLSEEQVANFRQEVTPPGLTSYPHPWLMPDFWQFATVSMGLGPLQAIYQARFLKYLANRKLLPSASAQKVWAFLGDGETDEPESLGALSIAAREKLDNLIFVVNCNLQRLDGPVRGNGKIIQELERIFHGAGWNVIKVVWGERWDALLEADSDGRLQQRMEDCVDGDYQAYKANDGAYVREHFFGKDPELKARVAHLTDEEIWHLNRGGHDPQKVFAAYAAAVQHKGQPTVILAKTVKGFGMGAAGEGQNITHQQKKMTLDELRAFRDRFHIPVTDEQIEHIPFYRPDENSPEIQYIKQQRQQLGGYLPYRQVESEVLTIPPLSLFSSVTEGSGDRAISTTMAFVRILSVLLKDKAIGKQIVPIVPDESRTFGMEGLFRQIGIYSPVGQLYTPVDKSQVMYYHESIDGQLLEEGINEAGAFCSWMAAGTSYSTTKIPMIPFYIYYSMFGFQRIGDLAWAAGDMQVKGFLLGATAGRTTLAGEGLQHQDGQSHLYAATIPNCVAYDPAYAYELAVIIQHGLERMFVAQESVFYYLTVMNENVVQPSMPKDAEAGIIKGMHVIRQPKKRQHAHVRLLGSGMILQEVLKAAELLAADYDISADVWSVTSFTELRKEALSVERHRRLHPEENPAQRSYVETQLADIDTPIIAATDYVKLHADQIRPFIQAPYITLGTDGYGRSDTRAALRAFFEVNANWIAFTAVEALVNQGLLKKSVLMDAMHRYEIDPNKPDPVTV